MLINQSINQSMPSWHELGTSLTFTWLENALVWFLVYFTTFFIHAVLTASKGKMTAVVNCFVGGDMTTCFDVMTSALKMQAAGFCVSSVHIYQTTRRCIKRRLFYDMISHDIYLLQLGFHPVAAVGRVVQKLERDIYIYIYIYIYI